MDWFKIKWKYETMDTAKLEFARNKWLLQVEVVCNGYLSWRLRSGDVAVDVEWILGQITQVLQHNEEQPRAVDGRHVEFASIARILFMQLKTDYSTCSM